MLAANRLTQIGNERMSTTATKHLPDLRIQGWPILCQNSELGWSATQIVLSELDAVRGEENNQVDVQSH